MNIGVNISFSIFVFFEKYLKFELLGPTVVPLLIFWGIFILFSSVAALAYDHTKSAQGFLFAATSPAPAICCLFDNSFSDTCEVISHCGFDLHLSDDWWCEASFHVSAGHLHVFFGEMSVDIFCPLLHLIVFQVLNCMCSLYILYSKPYRICHLQISSFIQ